MNTQEIAVMEDQQYSPQQITLDDSLFNKCHRLAQMMASGACTVPKHLQGNVGDCFAIVGQSLRWGMDPYAVAQKTHLVNGTLGYEAQLVIAVINNRAPIVGRLKFEYFGDWSKVKSKDDKSDDVGVICRATFKGDDHPTELSLTMAQVGHVRNSPLWVADPRQQLAYLTAKRFTRLHCPDVVLGVYTPDELETRSNDVPRNVTPKAANAGASALLNRVKQPTAQAPVIEYYDITELSNEIYNLTNLEHVKSMGEQIRELVDNPKVTFKDGELDELREELKTKKSNIITATEYRNIMQQINDCQDLETAERLKSVIDDKAGDFGEATQTLYDKLEIVAEEIGAQG